MSLLLIKIGTVGQGGAAPPVVEQTVSYTSTSSLTVVFSTTPAQNDLLLVMMRTSSTSVSPPSGFTQIGSYVTVPATGSHLSMWRKVAGASETNSYAFTGGTIYRAVAYDISGIDTTTPITQSGSNTASSVTSLDCAGTDFSIAAGSLLVAAVALSLAATGGSFAFDNGFGNILSPDNLLSAAYKQNAAAATGQNTNVSWTTTRNAATMLVEIAGG